MTTLWRWGYLLLCVVGLSLPQAGYAQSGASGDLFPDATGQPKVNAPAQTQPAEPPGPAVRNNPRVPAVALTPVAPAPAVVIKKIAIPDAAALKEAQGLVNDVYKDDLKAAVTPEQKSALAQKILDAVKDEPDAAGRFALMCTARDTAISAGDFALASAAIDAMDGAFVVDALKMEQEAVTDVSKTARTDAQRGELAGAIDGIVDKAVQADRFDIAKSLMDVALAAARLTDNADLKRTTAAKLQQVRDLDVAYERTKAALDILSSNPKDPDANFVVGRYRCFYKGDWAGGLAMLALGSDAGAKSAAQAELLAPTDASAQVAVGDGWWKIAQKETGVAKGRLLSHAGEWYQKAAPHLTGLAKAEVAKKLAEIPPDAGETSGTINLLKLFTPAAVVGGEWQIRDGALVSGTEAGSRVEFPYQPPLEYDFRIVFSRLSGSDGIVELLAAGGRQFGWSMGSKGTAAVGGFELVGGRDATSNRTRIGYTIEPGKRYDSLVQVRRDGVRAFINGTLVCQWRTNFSDMSIYPGWRLRTGQNLGVGSWASSVIFYKIEVTEITGKGKITP